jgi:hypothetical protein
MTFLAALRHDRIDAIIRRATLRYPLSGGFSFAARASLRRLSASVIEMAHSTSIVEQLLLCVS